MNRIAFVVLSAVMVLASCSPQSDPAGPGAVRYEVIHGKATAPIAIDVAFDQPPALNKQVTLSCSVTPQAEGDHLEVRVILPKGLAKQGQDGGHLKQAKPQKGKTQALSCACTVSDNTYQEITVVATLTVGTARLTRVTTVAINPEAKPKEINKGKADRNAQGEPILEFQEKPKNK